MSQPSPIAKSLDGEVTKPPTHKGEFSGKRSNPFNLEMFLMGATVTCLLTLLLDVFVLSSAGLAANRAGTIARYVGAIFLRSAEYFSIPIGLSVWAFALHRKSLFSAFQSRRSLAFVVFIFYSLFHLLLADPVVQASRLEMLMGIFSSPSPEFQLQHFGLVKGLIPILLLAVPLCNRRGCGWIRNGLIVAGSIFCLALIGSGQFRSIFNGEGLQGFDDVGVGRVTLGMDTITSASVMYTCVLAGILWLIDNSSRYLFWPIVILMCGALTAMGLLTGSKGPLVALVVSVVISLVVYGKLKSLVPLGIVTVSLIVGISLLDQYEGAIKHLLVGAEDENRTAFYQFVLKSTPTFLGNGVGAFAANMGLDPAEGGYVHNSILEVYYEMGIMGLLLFVLVLGLIGWKLFRAIRKQRDPIACFVLAYFLYGFTFSLFSGTIYGDTPLLLGMLLGCAKWERHIDA